MAKVPKKIAGVKTPIALAALALLVGVLYLRHRAASAATSSAGPAATTFDSGLGAGGSGAVSTPTDNGLGSTTVGTDGTQSAALWDTLLSAYGISSQANADLASHAGTYTNYSTTTNFNGTPSTWNAGVTTPGGYSSPSASPPTMQSFDAAGNPLGPAHVVHPYENPPGGYIPVKGAATAKLA